MDLSDAANYAQLLDTRDRLASSPSTNWYERAHELGTVSTAIDQKKTRRDHTTVGDILRTAIGGALGYGLGRGASAVLGLPSDKTDTIAFTGAMLGGLMGLTKSAEDARTAFRAAFIKAAIDHGYFKEAGLTAPFTGLSNLATRLSESAGSIIGHADAPDDIDEDVVREKVEAELMRQEASRVEALRRNMLLKKVLAKRRFSP